MKVIKSISIFRAITLLLLLALAGTTLQANNRVRIVNGNNDDGGPPTGGVNVPPNVDGCSLTFRVNVILANLVGEPLNYYFPHYAPDIFVKCVLEDETYFLHIDPTHASSMGSVDGEPIFSVSRFITTDIFDPCHNYSVDKGGGLVLSIPEQLNFEYTLHLENGEPYPIASYANMGELFSCGAFLETEMLCGNDGNNDGDPETGGPNGEAYINPTWEAATTLECCECNEQLSCEEDQKVHQNNRRRHPDQTQQLVAEPHQVFPNPFSRSLALQLALPYSQTTEIEVFDAKGQLVYREQRVSANDEDNLSFDTNEWADGLYFIKVSTPSSMQTLKVVKAR